MFLFPIWITKAFAGQETTGTPPENFSTTAVTGLVRRAPHTFNTYISHFANGLTFLSTNSTLPLYSRSFLFNMADFSNMEDEIPYPLPPTKISPTTTKLTKTPTAPVLHQVPTPSLTFDLNCSPSQHKKSIKLCSTQG
jgi:hypothetical protein